MNLTIAAPVLIEEGILSSSQIGLMGGVFFLLYSLGQLLNGWLGDIFSSRRMVTAGLLLTAASNVVIGLLLQADNAVCLWAVNGFAQSMKEAHIPARGEPEGGVAFVQQTDAHPGQEISVACGIRGIPGHGRGQCGGYPAHGKI